MNENLILTKESVPSDIERYFRGVLALDQQDKVITSAKLSPLVRAKALKYRTIYKAFALTGRFADCHYYPGRCPGLRASAPSGRVGKNLRNFNSILTLNFHAFQVFCK